MADKIRGLLSKLPIFSLPSFVFEKMGKTFLPFPILGKEGARQVTRKIRVICTISKK